MVRNWRILLANTLTIGTAIIYPTKEVLAQNITTDGTVGTPQTLTGPNYEIPESLGQTVNSNLFHSFGKFNLDSNEAAIFQSGNEINNIFSRVTGGSPSSINGLIQTLGQNVNLFFLNPSGIIFGPNASLDVSGSFLATTADSFVFGDGLEFSATNPQSAPLLTVNFTPGLQYGQNHPSRTIENQGNLFVGSQQRLTLAGNQVTSTGSLTAPGGRVELLGRESVALSENATIDVSSSNGRGTVLIGGDFQGKGTTLPNAQRTNIGNNVTINADALTNGNGGRVIVWADEVTGFYGKISARGGVESGNGGLVEVSGKEHLIFRGNVNTSAVNGLPGTLLLDPTNIIIADGTDDEAGDGTDIFAGNNSGVVGSILSAPLSEINDTAPTTIYESELEGLSGDTNIILQATNNITLENLSDDALELAAGTGVIALSADADGDGVGDFVMEDNIADTIFTNGRDVGISGASLTIGSINTSQQLGNSGSIALNATGDVNINDVVDTSGNLSDGGAVNITARALFLTKSAQINSSSTGKGNAGDVKIIATEKITLDSSDIFSFSNVGELAEGNSGDITIDTGSLSLQNRAFLFASILGMGMGNAGDVKITATEAITLDNSGIISEMGGEGNAGNITISSDSLFLQNSLLSTGTFGQGNAGSVFIQAKNSVLVSNSLISTPVGSSGIGKGGDININAASLYVEDGAQLQSAIFINRETLSAGRGDAGNINIDVTGAVKIAGVTRAPSGLFSLVSTGGVGNGGKITISANSFSLLDGANIFANTNGQGNGGTIQINAKDSVTISGTSPTRGDSSEISARTNSLNREGDIIINTRNFNLSNGGVVNAQTVNDGNGGNITVNARRVEVINGGQLLSDTSSRGNAGKIVVNATAQVIVDGIDTTLNDRIAKFGTDRLARFGTSRGITNTLENGASGFFVRSQGSGNAGDIEVTSPKIQLDNQGRLFADSASGNGGNIRLQVGDLLLLRPVSAISATAGTAQEGGDGGNIKINSDFILAFPTDNKYQITANAFEGNGGNIEITTNSFFGREFVNISASSEFGLEGDVSIDILEIDPARGLTKLPTDVIDASQQITQGCTPQESGRFVAAGRGGLPLSPNEPLRGTAVITNWVDEPTETTGKVNNQLAKKLLENQSNPKIVEAQAWIINARGNVELVTESSVILLILLCRLIFLVIFRLIKGNSTILSF